MSNRNSVDLNADADRRVGAALRLIGSPVYRAVLQALEAHAIDKERAAYTTALLAEVGCFPPGAQALDDRLRRGIMGATAGFTAAATPAGGTTDGLGWDDERFRDE